MKPKLLSRFGLDVVGGMWRALPASKGVAAIDPLLPCQFPAQPGCAECCVEQSGPGAGGRICYRRTASDGHPEREEGREYTEAAAFLEVGRCPATCRRCAPCTRDRKKSYQQLLSKGCDCLDPFVREVVRSIDPCFSDGCGCVCSQLSALSECGPPI